MKVSREYLKNWENVEGELGRVIEGNAGEFPTGRILHESGKGYLVRGIQKHHGGLNVARKRMGFPLKKTPPNYWKNDDNFNIELDRLKQDYGEIPSATQLREMGKGGLVNHINKYCGGMSNLRP